MAKIYGQAKRVKALRGESYAAGNKERQQIEAWAARQRGLDAQKASVPPPPGGATTQIDVGQNTSYTPWQANYGLGAMGITGANAVSAPVTEADRNRGIGNFSNPLKSKPTNSLGGASGSVGRPKTNNTIMGKFESWLDAITHTYNSLNNVRGIKSTDSHGPSTYNYSNTLKGAVGSVGGTNNSNVTKPQQTPAVMKSRFPVPPVQGKSPLPGTSTDTHGSTQGNVTTPATTSSATTSSGSVTSGSQTIDPNAPKLPALPYKAGGWTTAEMEAAYGGKTVAPYSTGYDYANQSPRPAFSENYVANTGHSYAGFYAVKDPITGESKWYPIDQSKVAAYNNGGNRGGGGGDNHPFDTPSGGGTNAYNVEGAPNWWTGTLIPNATTDEQKYANMLNASIPYMSPEDQQKASTYLAVNFPEFSHYKNIAYEAPPAEITTGIREQFGSRDRANQLLDTLLKIREASGITEDQMGPGYQYIKQVADILARFGGGAIGTNNYQTREQYQQMLTALDPLLNQAQQSGSPYSAYLPIAQNLYNPTFTAGSLWDISRNEDGSYSFGAPNKTLF